MYGVDGLFAVLLSDRDSTRSLLLVFVHIVLRFEMDSWMPVHPSVVKYYTSNIKLKMSHLENVHLQNSKKTYCSEFNNINYSIQRLVTIDGVSSCRLRATNHEDYLPKTNVHPILASTHYQYYIGSLICPRQQALDASVPAYQAHTKISE